MPTVESSSVASCSLELTMPIVESAAAGTGNLGPHDEEILDECTSIATDRHALWHTVEPDIILTAASKLSVSSHEAISVIHGQAHSSVGQYNRIVKECMPNVDAANHMTNADAAQRQ